MILLLLRKTPILFFEYCGAEIKCYVISYQETLYSPRRTIPYTITSTRNYIISRSTSIYNPSGFRLGLMDETPSLVVFKFTYLDTDCIRWPVVPLSILVLTGHSKNKRELWRRCDELTQHVHARFECTHLYFAWGHLQKWHCGDFTFTILIDLYSCCVICNFAHWSSHTFVEQMSSRRPDDTKHKIWKFIYWCTWKYLQSCLTAYLRPKVASREAGWRDFALVRIRW